LETEIETTMVHGPSNLGSYDDIVTTDESGGCSSDGGGSVENLVGTRTISAQPEINQKEECNEETIENSLVVSKIQRLKDNVSRINQFLLELKALSESCQEYIPAIEYEVDEEGELHKDRQVFIRRIVQLRAELHDAKDTILSICKESMPTRQWRILLDITGPSYKPNFLDEDDESILALMGSCNLDPSIRFFGIEWERVFGKCFSLSLNVKIFGQQIMNSKKDIFCTSVGSSIDLILVSTMLNDFSTLEADVTSHGEAVLQGRLSKSQQRLIRREQLKNCAPLSSGQNKNNDRRKKSMVNKTHGNKNETSLMKSKSFRYGGATNCNIPERKQSAPVYKYRKNKTTNLEKLGNELEQNSISPVRSSFRTSREAIMDPYLSNETANVTKSSNESKTTNRCCDNNLGKEENNGEEAIQSLEMTALDSRYKKINDSKDGDISNFIFEEPIRNNAMPKKKRSILQHVSKSILKSIR
jgi:hypothetical protein